MNAPMTRQTLALEGPSLLRQQCYVDGRWVDADSGAPVGPDDEGLLEV